MKTKLGLTALLALAITGAAFIGSGNTTAASNTGNHEGISMTTKAPLNASPQTIAAIAATKDTADYTAALYIPDPTATAFNDVQQVKIEGLSTGKEEGITAGANTAPPTNTVNVLKNVTNVATNGNTADMVNTHAPNTGTDQTVALVAPFFGTGQVLLRSWACRTRP